MELNKYYKLLNKIVIKGKLQMAKKIIVMD